MQQSGLLTIAEYERLPEDTEQRWELQEGRLVLTPYEYADAGIPHYWIINVDDPVSLVECHLAGEFGYWDNGGVTGEFATVEPFPVCVDLNRLVRFP